MRSRWAVAAALVVLALASTALPACPARAAGGDLGPLRRTGKQTHFSLRSQGLASSTALPGWTVYTSQFTLDLADAWGTSHRFTWGIPLDMMLKGYSHIGDPDMHGTDVLVAYEGGKVDGQEEKAFGIFDARTLEFQRAARHPLGPGEMPNNSWVAASPDGDWFLSGEWGSLTRFLVWRWEDLAMPTIEVAAEVHLDAPVTNVQGCDFATPTQLFCLSDDEGAGNPALQVDLEHAIDGTDADAHVSVLGPEPKEALLPWLPCKWPHEAEGVDVTGGTYRLMVVDPCIVFTHEYRYVRP